MAIEAFHTDADTGDARPEARLIPGLRAADQAGQLAFRQAFARATAAGGLGSADLGLRVTPHLLRKSIATDIAWQQGSRTGSGDASWAIARPTTSTAASTTLSPHPLSADSMASAQRGDQRHDVPVLQRN